MAKETFMPAGRPSHEDKRKNIIEEYGFPLYEIMSGEAGKPAEELTAQELATLVKALRKERGMNFMYLRKVGREAH